MQAFDIHHNSEALIALANQSITTSTTTNGAIIDTLDSTALEFLFAVGTITDGNYAISLQHDDLLAFSTAATVDSDEILGTAVYNNAFTALSATIAAGGTGYAVSDQITLSGGTVTTAAVFNVDTVSSGVITAVSLVTAGLYTTKPSNPVSTTGGTGSGGTLTVSFNSGVDDDTPKRLGYIGKKQFVRVSITSTGVTSGVANFSSMALLANAAHQPTSDQ